MSDFVTTILIKPLLKLAGFKKNFSSEKGLQRRIRQNQSDRRQTGEPPLKMYKNFNINSRTEMGSKIYTLTPQSGKVDRHILYWHGGAYVSNMSLIHWRFVGYLASELDAAITIPIYPLLPAHTAEDLIPFVMHVYEKLLKEVSPGCLTVMGDSAGGSITMVLAQEAYLRNLPQPASLVMISPWLDATMSDPELKNVDARDPLISISGLKATAELYAGSLHKTHPWVSPIFGSMEGLPPIQLFAGTDEILVIDARNLKAKSKEQDFSIEYHEGEGLLHVWPIMGLPESKKAREQICNFIQKHTAEVSGHKFPYRP